MVNLLVYNCTSAYLIVRHRPDCRYSLGGKCCTHTTPKKLNKLISVNLWFLKIRLYFGDRTVNSCSTFEEWG